MRIKNRFFFFAVIIAIFLWIVETNIHVFIFKTGSFIEELFPLYNPNELWMRMIIVSIVILAGSISQNMANKITTALEREKEINNKLESSMKEIKLLRGILPICASCKKIRNEKGYWDQVEAYISKHSEAEFSHGICPECEKKLYSEYFQDDP